LLVVAAEGIEEAAADFCAGASPFPALEDMLDPRKMRISYTSQPTGSTSN